MENKQNKPILEVKNLKKYFPIEKDIFGKVKKNLRAVDDVSFILESGKTIGVVGESGCGKTTLGRTILQLYDTTDGKTLYYGHTIEEFKPKYYLNELHKLPTYARKYQNLIKNLKDNYSKDNDYENYLIEDFENLQKEIISKKQLVSNELNKEKLNQESNLNKDKVNKLINEYKEVSKLENVISEILSTLKKASSISGGYLLTDTLYTKNILVNIFKGLSDDSDSLKSYVDMVRNKKLFDELESRREAGLDLARLTKKELRSLRTEIQLIFQDPYSSLPPRMSVGAIITEAVKVHKIVEPDKVGEHVRKIMKMCGLQPQYYDRYPHEFSGGQRQRICIARALAVNPKLVICDEPVSALDVSIQAQIINLLKELQNTLGLTYMFISHDLSVVKYITDSIIVMYLGNMMEIGNTKDIFANPLHPYTKALFSAVPVPDPNAKMQRIILKGDIPSPANPPKGCKFHTRCEKCMSVCKLLAPKFIEYSDNHKVACHLFNEEVMNNLDKYDLELKEFEEAERLKQEEENNKASFINKLRKK